MADSKKISKYLAIGVAAIALSASPTHAAETAPPRAEELSAAMRSKLLQPAELALQEHCGEDCPSFRIDPLFKKLAPATTLDDLGFSQPSQPDQAPELVSVSVSVLVHDRVSSKARESLRKIVASRLTNEAGVPVTVRMVALDAFAPLMEKRVHPDAPLTTLNEKVALAKASIWPICLLLLAGAALFGLIKILRSRKELQDARIAAQNAASNALTAQEATVTEVTEQESILELMNKRTEDLRWLIENAALRADRATLSKALAVIPAHELTSKARFSREALTALASLPLDSVDRKEAGNADRKWLVNAMDRAHWSRLEEQADQLSRIRRLPANRIKQLFSRLSSPATRAALVAALPEESWPPLLASLRSEERIELGLKLADYAAASSAERLVLNTEITHTLSLLDESAFDRSRDALESLSLYLPEKEGQILWQELSARALNERTSRVSPASMDSVLSDLAPADAGELCTRLDVGTLSIVLSQVSGETRARVFQNLPSALRTRLEASRAPANEADKMKARAALLSTYRSFKAEEAVQ